MKNSHKISFVLIASVLCLTSSISAQEADKISAASIIEKTLMDHNPEAAFIKFRELRAQEDTYAISQSEFLTLGSKLHTEGKTREAVAVFNMILDIFPDSHQACLALGQAYRSLGFQDKALEQTNRAYDIRNAGALAEFMAKNKDAILTSAEDVIDRYLAAIGGKENLMKIKTIRMVLTSLDAVHQEASLIRYYKHPHYYRQTVARSGASMVTDGDHVWRVTSEGWEENPQSNYRYASDIYGDFIDYENRGISYQLLGIEALDLQVVYCLLKTYKDGNTREYYFSAESGLFVMERRDFGIGKDIKRYYDWRAVDGILFPYLFVVTNKVGLGHSHGGIVKEIKINESLKDSLFMEQ